MPASDYGWMLSENKPLFQVYGTKRKFEGNDSCTAEEMVCINTYSSSSTIVNHIS